YGDHSVAIVIAAGVIAVRSGGGTEAAAPPPRATARPDAAKHGANAEGYEVRVRFLDRLSDARVDVPNLRASQPILAMHWRKMQTPWTPLAGEAAQLAYSIALRTSASEQAYVVSTPTGAWQPEARVWNMSEGSFDQREAIFAPA